MVKFCSLVSGSSGNATFLKCDETRILIDCGISARKAEVLLDSIGEKASQLSGILVTHEHSDHISGIRVLSKKYQIPIYATPQTWNAMGTVREACGARVREIEAQVPFTIGKVEIEPFEIPHDAAQPVCYSIYAENKKISVATDMGRIVAGLAEKLRQSDVVLLEANYDEEMLQSGPYPYYLKQRIAGNHGHLSNEQASRMACALACSGTRRIILGHLSEKNNLPQLAYDTVAQALTYSGFEPGENIYLSVAERYTPSNLIEL